MPTVAELTAPFGNFMFGPRAGPGVCRICFNLTQGYDRCFACTHSGQWLDAVAPISYSVAHEQLHHALAGYKRPPHDVARGFGVGLAAVLWRHLAAHESCVARAAGIARFDLVSTVPSSTRTRDAAHPLHQIIGQLVGPTRSRFERLLRRTDLTVAPREINVRKFEGVRELAGRSVLLIDDTWTTGANAQSAAAALRAAGAGPIAAVVIGRHVNREWRDNDRLLKALPSPFDWGTCAVHP